MKVPSNWPPIPVYINSANHGELARRFGSVPAPGSRHKTLRDQRAAARMDGSRPAGRRVAVQRAAGATAGRNGKAGSAYSRAGRHPRRKSAGRRGALQLSLLPVIIGVIERGRAVVLRFMVVAAGQVSASPGVGVFRHARTRPVSLWKPECCGQIAMDEPHRSATEIAKHFLGSHHEPVRADSRLFEDLQQFALEALKAVRSRGPAPQIEGRLMAEIAAQGNGPDARIGPRQIFQGLAGIVLPDEKTWYRKFGGIGSRSVY